MTNNFCLTTSNIWYEVISIQYPPIKEGLLRLRLAAQNCESENNIFSQERIENYPCIQLLSRSLLILQKVENCNTGIESRPLFFNQIY